MPGYAPRVTQAQATMLVVGGIIGSGIFLNPAVVAERAGTAGLTMTAWLVGGAVAVLGIGDPRMLERRNRAGTVTELLTQFAKHKPGRCIAGHKLDRLHHKVCSSGEIAFGLPVTGPFETAIGKDIAG